MQFSKLWIWKVGEEMELNHFDAQGNAVMVDVSEKEETTRTAVASGKIYVNQTIFDHIVQGDVAKGDVLGVARIAGIMASKKTSDLIPMCHPLMLTKSAIEFELDKVELSITAICTTKIVAKTGVEMEALTGVSTALLTIYDMCKAIDKGMVIADIHLVSKTGGKSMEYRKTP
jgi:cyclic pyranopterin phosphate synthase